VNDLLTYVDMLDSLIVANAQFVVMVTELQKVLSQLLKCLYSKTTTVLPEWTVPKTMDVSHLHFYCIQNKYIYCIEMCVYCIYN